LSVRIGGIGGQGNIKMGLILAKSLTYDKKWVVQSQHYGAQVRGGVAYSDVLFAQDPIDFPKAYTFNMLYMMDQKPLDSFINLLKPNGILFCDSTKIRKVPNFIRRITRKVIVLPITEMSLEKFGTAVVSNVVGLGLILKVTGIISLENLKKTIAEEISPKYYDMNMEAIAFGMSLCGKDYSLKDEKLFTKVTFE
jgi:2-oxoglutarate ferredoxin oxidoreductase subunit gamma